MHSTSNRGYQACALFVLAATVAALPLMAAKDYAELTAQNVGPFELTLGVVWCAGLLGFAAYIAKQGVTLLKKR